MFLALPRQNSWQILDNLFRQMLSITFHARRDDAQRQLCPLAFSKFRKLGDEICVEQNGHDYDTGNGFIYKIRQILDFTTRNDNLTQHFLENLGHCSFGNVFWIKIIQLQSVFNVYLTASLICNCYVLVHLVFRCIWLTLPHHLSWQQGFHYALNLPSRVRRWLENGIREHFCLVLSIVARILNTRASHVLAAHSTVWKV